MKSFAIALIVCVACAQYVSCYARNWQESNDYTDNNNQRQQQERQQQGRQQQGWQQQERQQQERQQQGRQQQGRQQQGRQQQGGQEQQEEQQPQGLSRFLLTPSKVSNIVSSIFSPSNNGNNGNNDNNISNIIKLPEAQSFFSKIVERLNNSRVLQAATQIKEKIVNYAAEKLNECRTIDGQSLDKHCKSRLLGTIMQIIAAAENAEHKLPFGLNSRSNGPVFQSESNY